MGPIHPRVRIALLLALALIVAACAETAPSADVEAGAPQAAAVDTSTPTTTEAAIAIDTFAYAPQVLEVPVGTTVVWANGDRIDHTVTSGAPGAPDGRFDGSLPDRGTTFASTFDTPGTYAYFCAIHPHMTGEVRVTG
jgi:plastocyanin